MQPLIFTSKGKIRLMSVAKDIILKPVPESSIEIQSFNISPLHCWEIRLLTFETLKTVFLLCTDPDPNLMVYIFNAE